MILPGFRLAPILPPRCGDTAPRWLPCADCVDGGLNVPFDEVQQGG
jgi:hypothetical protein